MNPRTATLFRAPLGVPGDLATSGGFAAWKCGMIIAVLAAVFGLLTVSLLTRGDEEAGRSEPVWSAVVPRSNPLVVAIITSWTA